MGWFFGYGSLVNHLTHENRPLHLARLAGWRREWCLTKARSIAFLSVRPCAGSEVSGLVSQVPNGDWAALDAREFAYDRHLAPVVAENVDAEDVAIYAVSAAHRVNTGQGVILLSYLDVVIEGYLHHFGPEGVAAFFATTDGWDWPVLDDRGAPQYPRHRDVGPEVRALSDQFLATLPAPMEQLDQS